MLNRTRTSVAKWRSVVLGSLRAGRPVVSSTGLPSSRAFAKSTLRNTSIMSRQVPNNRDPAVLKVWEALNLAISSGASLELVHTLESALNLAEQREEFADATTSEQSQTLKEIKEETLRHDWVKIYQEGKTEWRLNPRMLSGPLEGQFLKSLVSIQKAKRILEIGLFTGYSALAMAEALPADGEVVSIDMTEYLKPLVTDLTKTSPHHKKIKIVIGKAIEVLQDMLGHGEKFDMVFLDADKSEYSAYLKLVFDGGMLNPGGTVLVDNAFRSGDGYIPERGDNPSKQFAKLVSSDSSLHKVLVPLRDGILIIRRLSDVEGSTD